MRAEPDGEPVPVGCFARLADCHHDAAPVRVLARDGSLENRGVGDREPDPPGRAIILRPNHLDGNEFRQALAILDDVERQLVHHAVQRLGKRRENRIRRVPHLGRTALRSLPGREQQHRVAGRGVAIDGDAVESLIGMG